MPGTAVGLGIYIFFAPAGLFRAGSRDLSLLDPPDPMHLTKRPHRRLARKRGQQDPGADQSIVHRSFSGENGIGA
jgi:hypothetical protein